jgi:hypothetical protein
MRKLPVVPAAIVVGLFLSLSSAPAFAKCDRPADVTCKEEVNDTIGRLKHSGSLSDAIKNVGRVGNATENCVSCAADEVSTKIDNAFDLNSSDQSSDD